MFPIYQVIQRYEAIYLNITRKTPRAQKISWHDFNVSILSQLNFFPLISKALVWPEFILI
jgi:hypothetical protein